MAILRIVESLKPILERSRRPLRSLQRGLLDFLLPRACFACGAACGTACGAEPAAAGYPLGGYFCASCAATIRIAGPDACPFCGEIRNGKNPGRRCLRCVGAEFAFERCAAGAAYAGAVRDLVHGIKFSGDLRAAHPLGRLARLGAERALDGERPDSVTAVPLHPLKRLRRGYNQAEMIARIAARELGLTYRDDLVRRVRYTPSQGAATGRDRRVNLRGAFGPGRVRSDGMPRHVLIIDDVVSTAVTMDQCARALRAGGVGRVTGASAAT